LLYISVREKLASVKLPSLQHNFTQNRTKLFATIYVYSLIAYLTELLGAVEVLETSGFELAVAGLCRNLLEWTANACYLSNRLKIWQTAGNDSQALTVLEQLLAGNKWIGVNHSYIGVPKPINSFNFINEYTERPDAEFGDADAKYDYSMLCELTHANGMMLMQYQEITGHLLHFKRLEIPSHSDRINSDLINLIVFLSEILSYIDEKTVRVELEQILKSIAQ
jgi:hypothetical protein